MGRPSSNHGKVGVKCYVCHEAKKGDPSGYKHKGYMITAVPSPKYCEGCHGKEVEQYSKSKHAWTAVFTVGFNEENKVVVAESGGT